MQGKITCVKKKKCRAQDGALWNATSNCVDRESSSDKKCFNPHQQVPSNPQMFKFVEQPFMRNAIKCSGKVKLSKMASRDPSKWIQWYIELQSSEEEQGEEVLGEADS
ncbi:unnamed protein product [Callosobruchus maculatus]|uniref:Uncharacterized protein n=1 Tax=Callosobruchus maculatus TaxID=64391 RepID=A0A653DCS6_CALMS|nr:unnamed protein product [Callosobruchus maculatus]